MSDTGIVSVRIRPHAGAEGQISTGMNTDVRIDGRPPEGLQAMLISIDCDGVATVWTQSIARGIDAELRCAMGQLETRPPEERHSHTHYHIPEGHKCVRLGDQFVSEPASGTPD